MQGQNPSSSQQPIQQPAQQPKSYTNQLYEDQQTMASISKILLESPNFLLKLRREFRGETLHQFEDGTSSWIQICKPIFVKMDQLKEIPLKEKFIMPDTKEVREIYIPNDEAIEEILKMLKFAGVNQITSISNISEDNILDDLKEFECKLAGVLCLKQKVWGMDKELLPMLQFEIKTIVQDARYMACEGNTLKALQTSVKRLEQSYEGERKMGKLNVTPYT